MKLYHFSNSKIEKFEINNKKAIYCFDNSEIDFDEYLKNTITSFEEIKEKYEEDYECSFYDKAFFYGSNCHTIEVFDSAKILNVSEMIDEIRENSAVINTEFEKRIVLEDDDDVILENFYDTDLEELINEYALENGYDIVIWRDNTEGYDHKSYAIVNNNIIIK
jgi:hypothetical protein